MALFARSTRPNPTVEEMGVITRHGLLAHGTKPNPFVSPASYLAHSGTESAAGERALRRGCQEWTMRQIEAGIEAENAVPGPLGRHKPLVGSSTPLAALLLEMEKGRIPSDVMAASHPLGAIGSVKSFNVMSSEHTSHSLSAPLRRSQQGGMAHSTFARPSRQQNHIAQAAFKAKRAMAMYLEPEREPTPKPDWQDQGESDDDPLRGSQQWTRSGDQGQQHTVDIDEAWLDAKIESALHTLMNKKAAHEERLGAVIEKAGKVVSALGDRNDLQQQHRRLRQLEQELGGPTASQDRARRSRPSWAARHEHSEDQLKREIDMLDSQLSDIQMLISSTSSLAEDEISSGTSMGYASSLSESGWLEGASASDTAFAMRGSASVSGEGQAEVDDASGEESTEQVIETLKSQIETLERRLVQDKRTSTPSLSRTTRPGFWTPGRDRPSSLDSSAATAVHRKGSSVAHHAASDIDCYSEDGDGEEEEGDEEEEETKLDEEDSVGGRKSPQSQRTFHLSSKKPVSPVVNAVRDIVTELKSPRMRSASPRHRNMYDL